MLAVAERVLRGGSIEIYTSHWRSPILEDVEAQIVSISRGQPRWPLPFRYRRLRELAPNNETWSQQDRESFEAAYLCQLGDYGIEQVLAHLERVAGGRPTVLLCWERPTDAHCHRWTLAQWIEEKAGIVIPELEHGMLSKRPDAPQPALFDGREQV